jgi:endoribonuclease Nob1
MSENRYRNERRVLILDTTAFIMGYEATNISDVQFSVPMVAKELTEDSTPWLRFKIAQEKHALQVRSPEKKHLEEAKKIAGKMGEVRHLSDADMEILSLSLELKNEKMEPIIVSDDYAIQNIAEKIGIGYISLSTIGIRYQMEWRLYCPACHKRYPSSSTLTICRVCGSPLKKRAIKKAPVKRLERKE